MAYRRSGARRSASRKTIGVAIALAALVAAALACDTRDAGERYVVTLDLGPDLRALADQNDDDDDRADAAEARLRALGAAARPALLAALDHEPAPVRAAVAPILAALPDAAADATLTDRLERLARDDPDAGVRAAAVVALADAGAPIAPAVVEAALDDHQPAVRLAALGACASACRSDAALARVAELALRGDAVGPALAARRVLQLLRERSAVEPSVDAALAERAAAAVASSATPPERALAALLLADLGDARAVPALVEVVRGPASPLRVHAVWSLGRLGGAESVAALAPLLADPALAPYAIDALDQLSRRGVEGAAAAAASYDGPRPAAALPAPYVF